MSETREPEPCVCIPRSTARGYLGRLPPPPCSICGGAVDLELRIGWRPLPMPKLVGEVRSERCT